jgi:hypothetical protein
MMQTLFIIAGCLAEERYSTLGYWKEFPIYKL